MLNIEGIFIILMNIYGFNGNNQNKGLLSEVTDAITKYKEILYHTELILICGDLNLTPDEWEDGYP